MTLTLRSVSNGIEDYRAWATDPQPRIGLGLPFFDRRTGGGLAKAECCMVMAYSSVGKTWVALNAIVNNPRVPTVFFSLEMSWRQVTSRLAAISSGVPTWDLEQMLQAGQVPQPLIDTSIVFQSLLGDDRSALTLKDMKQGVMDAGTKLGKPVRLVIIDYLELIGGAGMLGKAEQVDKAAQKIRELAKDTDTAVIVLHQVSMTNGGGGSEPLDLGSGKFGGHQPMDYVVGAYAPRLDKKLTEHQVLEVQGDLYLQLLKNRNGKAHPTGVRHLLDPTSGRITPWGEQVVHRQIMPAFQPSLVSGFSRPEPELEEVPA